MASFEASLVRHQADGVIAVAGDWHGNTAWAREKIEAVAADGVSLILHLGDFGFWSGKHGKRYLQNVDKACEEFGVDIWVTGGNHEAWDRAYARWANPKRQDDRGFPAPDSWDTSHVWLLPRPFRFELDSVHFLSLGGAASVDFDMRTRGHDWWPEEMIEEDEVAAAVELGHADIMVCHESPNPPYAVSRVENILAMNPMGFSQMGLAYSSVSRRRLTQAFEAVRPRALYHGHLHVPGTNSFRFPHADYDSKVVALSEERTAYNVSYIDLEQYRTTRG